MPHSTNRLSALERREQILSVGMELFAQRGFQGTTTRQIAERAGVNEAILFRHFPSKEELYWAILDGKSRRARARERLETRLRAAADEQEALAAVAEDILRRNTEDPTLGRLLLFSALENHRLSHRFFRTHVARYYEALARHIREGIHAGRFRPVDPVVAARGFLGMVVYHFLIQELFGGRRYQKFDTRLVCRTLAEIWLEGMRVSGKRRANGRRVLRAQNVRFPRASKRRRG